LGSLTNIPKGYSIVKLIKDKKTYTNIEKIKLIKGYSFNSILEFNCKECGTNVTVSSRRGIKDRIENEAFLCRKCKTENTNINRYGKKAPAQNNIIKEKTKQTNLKKYGVEYVQQNKEVLKKRTSSRLDKFSNIANKRVEEQKVIFLEEYKGMRIDNKSIYYKFKCKKCNTEFEDNIHSKKVRCPVCVPNTSSIKENEVIDFIRSIYHLDIIENDRNILNGKEIDIYIPEKKVAIEFNGLYWHSELNGKNKDYHLNKTETCNNNGIKLIHIFEDEWDNKREIVKSIIRIKLGIVDDKIFARKTKILEINKKDRNVFLENNHLQGSSNSSINIGLFYSDELVSLLTFGSSRYNKNYKWEIHRFVSKKNTVVIGGFSKLLKYFTNNYSGDIITYSDKRYFTGKVYENNGFKKLEDTKQSYFYFYRSKIERLNRVKFQKHKLKSILKEYNPSITEWENMINNGYDRVWDCGNFKFELKNPLDNSKG